MSSRILLALFSCHEYKYEIAGMRDWFTRPVVDRVSGIRDSWLKDVTGDYKFFFGQGGNRQPLGDEIFLPVPDDYHHSFEKIKGVIKYALDNGYDYLCKVDDDVFVYYDRLMANAPTEDYVGSGRGWDIESSKRFPTDFAPGFTVWYSRKSMEILLRSPAGCWAEDRWCGTALKKAGIHLTPDYRYHLCKPTKTNQYISDAELYKPNDWLTIHSLSPDQMRRLHDHDHSSVKAS